jgi:hypothetical protein
MDGRTMIIARRNFLAALVGGTASSYWSAATAQQRPSLVEPVYRIATAPASATPAPLVKTPPLEIALQMARDGLNHSIHRINDYTATLVKRERVDGTVGEHDYMFVKVRNRKVANGIVTQPLSVYLTYLRPASVKGREVIYVEGQNDGNMIAHEGGFRGRFLPTMPLSPTGMMAMRGQRYPITEIGIENLIVKLIERGETAKRFNDVTCNFRKNAKVRDRVCTVLEVNQPTRHPELEFHQAQVFIDDELTLPIRYVAYDWPAAAGAAPDLIEEYNYIDLKLNVGLTDADFDPRNPQYAFYSK